MLYLRLLCYVGCTFLVLCILFSVVAAAPPLACSWLCATHCRVRVVFGFVALRVVVLAFGFDCGGWSWTAVAVENEMRFLAAPALWLMGGCARVRLLVPMLPLVEE